MISPHLPARKTAQAGERLVFELIKVLAEKHEVHLVVRIQSGQWADLEPLKHYCRAVYPVVYERPERRNLPGLPSVITSYYRLCREANALAAREAFDAVHAEWTETGLFLRKRKGMMVLEAHDVLSKPMERRYGSAKGWRRGLYGVLFLFTRVLERYIYSKFTAIFVLSEYDRRYLLSLSPSLNVAVLRYPAGFPVTQRSFPRDEKTLLFLGAMDRGPNVEAVRYFRNEILPIIRREIPDVRFLIAGSRPLPEVRALAEQDRNIRVTGFIDDVEACYREATVFVAPLLTGGGIIVKILDALAAGTPVTTTSVGNEGIGAVPDEHLLIGDGPAEFAEQVLRLLRDKPMRERIARAGREFVAVNFSNESLRKTVEQWYGA